MLNCRGKLLDLTSPKVMGILNVTPDSFYDGGRFQNEKEISSQVKKMIDEGAHIIDVGGSSSRPGSNPVTAAEEISRLSVALSAIRKDFPDIILSVDTHTAKVAEHVINEFHVDMINDISAGELDDQMFETIAKFRVPYIIMHMKGTPSTMQTLTQYDNILREIIDYFSVKVDRLEKLGVTDIIIDPGFGFSKTLEQNYYLLSQLHLFRMLEKPVLAGLSRKSMIYNALDIEPAEALNGTIVLNTLALYHGVSILRVHDVKEAVQTVSLVEKFRNSTK